MDFKKLLAQAKTGDQEAVRTLLDMYRPLLIKNAILAGRFDEDLYQELCITLLKCIRTFVIHGLDATKSEGKI